MITRQLTCLIKSKHWNPAKNSPSLQSNLRKYSNIHFNTCQEKANFAENHLLPLFNTSKI